MLTFDYAQTPVVMADLVLCAPVVEREAREQGKTLEAHYAHLLVHGTLHAQGWDHETGEADAQAMEARETAILARARLRRSLLTRRRVRPICIGMVTGPSLTRCTCMSAPNSPVATCGCAFDAPLRQRRS